MQSTMKIEIGPMLASLKNHARMFVLAAMAAGVLLLSGSAAGTAFAEPSIDPAVVISSAATGSGIMVLAEENDWPTHAPKAVIAKGDANVVMALAEENDWLP